MAVKQVWNDEEIFGVELTGSGWGVVYAFPIKELANGASLARMMNTKVRNTVKTSGWSVPEEELRAVAKEGVAALREVIEPYFEARGGGQ
ncbi:hypothetical protein MAL1_00144 [Bacteriophage DSS3_MAL1]|nr:hypothetical protein MAL1_00144 [Bacteriophage DSS3_MAL1]